MATSRNVLDIIASLDGGYNGDLPGYQIGVDITSDTEATYTLTHTHDASEVPYAALPLPHDVDTFSLVLTRVV